MATIRFRTDLEKNVLLSNFEKRHWERAGPEDSWNFYWAVPASIRSIFSPSLDSSSAAFRLNDRQVLNHFPNHSELTRKDLMAKNCKRYKRDMEKVGKDVPDMVPLTFLLPQEYTLFVDFAQRQPGTVVWIVKPTGLSQGKGISLFTKVSAVKHLQPAGPSKPPVPQHVVSYYVHNPLLVGGKKFDLRIYVLVTSYKPLKIWLYREGFARFTTVPYKFSTKERDLENSYMHLTNVAIQKHNDDYNSAHGGKWTLKNLRLWMEGTMGTAATNKCFRDMELVIYHTLKAVQPVMQSDRHCFEVYGFDLMLDDALKPWLIEVNASPALTSTTESDRLMKYALISDTLDVVMPDKLGGRSRGTSSEDPAPEAAAGAGSAGDAAEALSRRVGGYELLYDETMMVPPEAARKSGPGAWK